MSKLTTRAKVLISGEVAAALVIGGFASANWSSSRLSTFLVLLLLSCATAAMKVVLPGVQCSLSVSHIFVMWGIISMSMGEALVLGISSALVQTFWQCKQKPKPVQIAFNLAVMTVSTGLASAVFRSDGFVQAAPNPLIRILLATVAFFIWNTVSVSAIIAFTQGLSVWNVWRTSYMWSVPQYLLSSAIVGAVEDSANVGQLEVAILVLLAAYVLFTTFRTHVSNLNEHLERVEDAKRFAEDKANLHLRTIRSLALAIEAKDRTTGEHLHRVQTYTTELAKVFGLAADDMEALRAAAILHDVGKIAVPEYIINKPGKLTPDEFAKMKIHTVVGAEIVANAQFPFAVAPLVRAHHEKWDGSGYPDGLRGEEIPMGARILAAVDCLDALASERQYRKALPLEEAMAIVRSEAGRSFDPRVVDALAERCFALEKLAASTLQSDYTELPVHCVVERGLAPDAGYASGYGATGADAVINRHDALRERDLIRFINLRIGQSDSMEGALLVLEEALKKLIPFDCMALFGLSGTRLSCVYARGESSSLLRSYEIQPGTGVSGWTFAYRMPLINGNAATESGIGGKVEAGYTLSSALSIPLESESGPIGVFTLYSCKREAFRADHLRVLLAIRSALAYHMAQEYRGLPRFKRARSQTGEFVAGKGLANLLGAVQEGQPAHVRH